MTCVIRYLDKDNDCVYLGGDSLGSNGWTKTVYKQRKVFHSKDTDNLIIGLSGTFNFQALEYEKLFDELELLKDKIDREYLITKFVPKLREIVNKYNANTNKNSLNQMEGELLFGYKNQLFQVQCDYSLLEPSIGFNAIGCGYQVALGSLYTTKDTDLSIEDKIVKALEASEALNEGVQRPFYIVNTKNKEIKEIK